MSTPSPSALSGLGRFDHTPEEPKYVIPKVEWVTAIQNRAEMKTWAIAFGRNTKLHLSEKAIPDKETRIAAWSAALHTGASKGKFHKMTYDLDKLEHKGFEGPELFEKIKSEYGKEQAIETQEEKEKFCALERREDEELSVIDASDRMDGQILSCEKAGYVPPEPEKKEVLENVMTDDEFEGVVTAATLAQIVISAIEQKAAETEGRPVSPEDEDSKFDYDNLSYALLRKIARNVRLMQKLRAIRRRKVRGRGRRRQPREDREVANSTQDRKPQQPRSRSQSRQPESRSESSSGKAFKCKDCGYTLPYKGEDNKCPAVGVTCKECGEKDHFAFVCPDKKKDGKKGGKGGKGQKKGF
uniref:CCHC-type domain-containing protein n=1 Tax=Chromera velia CCMP2878 TaxID=1169474 RepID=A0A0G4HJB1_9ALVE|eukprot:Cvel_7101.t1-p1 / transcript=Cvel_7101.t1 / gene=Cvel_7101 / organism=Chromera_velia_CCMP2878 / gene_product=hypothetical protein / transcript_product=hypothetical protein / location=Cvel_scaffold364:9123-10187(+) / protein_length=355 / sequence_SO=supercontig / SO=protein_coding / is_pseudo=false